MGEANLPTTNNSLLSLYNPTVVTYGLKFDPVAKLAISASFIDFIFLAEILEVLLNSCSSIVH